MTNRPLTPKEAWDISNYGITTSDNGVSAIAVLAHLVNHFGADMIKRAVDDLEWCKTAPRYPNGQLRQQYHSSIDDREDFK